MGRGGRRAGAGRKPGSRSRLTIKLKATLSDTAKQYTAEAVQVLVDVMGDKKATASARASCALAILDRGHGRPAQQLEHTGKDGGPIETKDAAISDLELARRVHFILTRATKSKG